MVKTAVFFFCFVFCPSKQFFSHVRTAPPLPGYYKYFLGGKCILLKDTTQRPECGSNPRPLDPEFDALPLGHHAFPELQTGFLVMSMQWLQSSLKLF